jgi:TolB-like protein/Flp pilus assembly protein TadD
LPGDRRIVLRIGINLGDVIIEGSDLYGDGVNMAARLEPLAEPGGICVSAKVHGEVAKKLRLAFDYMGEKSLKNMDEPVGVYRLSATVGAGPTGRPAPSSKPSIAVLPFTNMSGDPEQEYFSDGITEDIITELSRFHSLFVIARNSSFAYKGRAMNVREIGRDMGVRYVAEGSVRRADNRVRITAQLIDAQTGAHLWAERYDRDLEDIFAVQDEVTRRIVTSLVPRIEAEELATAKRKPPEDMRAYDLYLRAKSLVDMAHDVTAIAQAREYCDRAIQLDASYARVRACKALTYIFECHLMLAENVDQWRMKAMECAETAVALDPTDGVCQWSLGEAALLARQFDRARSHLARARELNPNDPDLLAISGWYYAVTGNPEAGLRYIEMALERNPQSISWHHWTRGIILFLLGWYEDALRDFNLYNPPNSGILRWRAATLVQLGRIDEARADVQAFLAIRPGATLSEVRKYANYQLNTDQYLDGLRQAGLPE